VRVADTHCQHLRTHMHRQCIVQESSLALGSSGV
jgi:hypothetical protein